MYASGLPTLGRTESAGGEHLPVESAGPEAVRPPTRNRSSQLSSPIACILLLYEIRKQPHKRRHPAKGFEIIPFHRIWTIRRHLSPISWPGSSLRVCTVGCLGCLHWSR